MLDRCLEADDGKGLGQGLTDNLPTTATFHLLLEATRTSAQPSETRHYVSPPLRPSLLSHLISASLNNPPLLFVGASGSAVKPHSTRSEESTESMQSAAQGGENGTFDVDGHTRHVGCTGEVEVEGAMRRSSSSTNTTTTSSSSSSSRSKRNIVGGWQVDSLPQPFSLLTNKPLPCDLQVVSLSVHRPEGTSQVSSGRVREHR